MKILFFIRDFLSTRNGKIILASSAILISISWLNSRGGNSLLLQSSPEGNSNRTRPGSDALFQQVEKNDSFEAFVPPLQKDTTPITLPEKTSPPLFEIPIVEVESDLPPLIEPLIKEEREASPKEEEPEILTSVQLPQIQIGSRIHCQLISSPSSDENDAPIIAKVTHPFIRDGILLVPAGSSVFGQVRQAKNDSLIPKRSWTIRTPEGKSLAITAATYVQSKERFQTTPGLAGYQEDLQTKKTTGRMILANFAKGFAALSRDTIRTGIGDYFPASSRNVMINGTSQVIEGLVRPQKNQTPPERPSTTAIIAQQFTLLVTSAGDEPANSSLPSSNVDSLLEQMLQKQLDK